jgi:MYXO-CTERM domain-containing protein
MTRVGLLLSVGLVVGTTGAAEADAAERVRGRAIRVDPPPVSFTADEMPQYGAGHLLFLNRCPGGIEVSFGTNDDSRTNKSMIVEGTIHLNEFPWGDASWNQIVQDVREMFSPFGVTVTDIDPGNVPHDEVIVCGSDTAAGMEPAAGVAAWTCEPIPNAVTFTFPETIGDDTRYTSETIAQEAAHAWGLDHSFKCEDPMTYLLGCGNKSFQDGDYPCGEYEARACDCGGDTQNTYQHLLGMFGSSVPDTSAPVAEIVAPVDGDEFEPGADFDIAIDVSDDVDVMRAVLFVNDEQMGLDEAAPFDGWPVDGIEAGEYTLRVEAQDAAGNVGQSNMVRISVGMLAEPDDSGESGGDSGGDDEGSDESGNGGAGIEPGAFPTQRRGDPSGCACRSHPGTGGPFGLLLFMAAALRRRRRSA